MQGFLHFSLFHDYTLLMALLKRTFQMEGFKFLKQSKYLPPCKNSSQGHKWLMKVPDASICQHQHYVTGTFLPTDLLINT